MISPCERSEGRDEKRSKNGRRQHQQCQPVSTSVDLQLRRKQQSGRRLPRKLQSGRRQPVENCSLVNVDREKCSGRRQWHFLWPIVTAVWLMSTEKTEVCRRQPRKLQSGRRRRGRKLSSCPEASRAVYLNQAQKISPTHLLSTLGCLWLCNTVTL